MSAAGRIVPLLMVARFSTTHLPVASAAGSRPAASQVGIRSAICGWWSDPARQISIR